MKHLGFLFIVSALLGCSSKPVQHNSRLQTVYPSAPIRSPACGGGGLGGQLDVGGDQELAKSLDGARLICKIGNLVSEGTIVEAAKYRCMNSDSYLSLQTYGQNRTVSSVQKNSEGKIVFETSRVVNLSFDYRTPPPPSSNQEQVLCEREDAFTGDRRQVLKISDYECMAKVHSAFHSKFIQSYFAFAKTPEGKKMNLGTIGDLKFEMLEVEPGRFTATNLWINGQSYTGTGKALVKGDSKSCQIEATASLQ